MKKVAVIGDPHGMLKDYQMLVNKYNSKNIPTLTVGDNGFHEEWEWGLNNLNTDMNKWLHGNHDCCMPDTLNSKLALGNSNYWNGIYTIRGSVSIDKMHRRTFIDYFPNEELSYAEFDDALNLYLEVTPEIVVSHDCPTIAKEIMFGYGEKDLILTNKLLQELYNHWKPRLWIFGHYHQNQVYQTKDTTFICLDELQPLVINVNI